ncbi:MAG TPA: xanthine dehydrogenase accessory protein XdhC [Steroidobacteraceae bacterium]|jgi:xanthine dehydrogenase accessory factor|nr:xanthine dehydrogenase accessory protein XdhC [Steroidobacteraceae bacterium]
MSWPAAPRTRALEAPAVPRTEWLKPLRDWPQALLRALQREPVIIRIIVTEVLGSAPREAGVCMLVGRDEFQGTIGGGQLEWQVLSEARTLLAGAAAAARIQRLVLGAELAQCCGGVVEVWMERYTRADCALLRAASDAAHRGAVVLISTITPVGVERRMVSECGSDPQTDLMLRHPRALALPRVTGSLAGHTALRERLDEDLPALWLYGAGHVGQALARVVAELPLRLTWIDTRAELFPAQIPDAVRIVHAPDLLATVAAAPAGARFLVLTHSHPLDYALCRAILERGDFASLGLIGSRSKGARFRSRLARDGVPAASIARLLCPIGADGIASKWPAAIAVAVAFELLRAISDSSANEQAACAPAPADAACGSVSCASCRPPDGAA